MPLSLLEFVIRWKASTLAERRAAQSHFIDLCAVLEQPHPAAADQTGDSFTFEKHVSKLRGGKGYADVWKRDYFAWEYKGKHKDLQAAYAQLADYREDLKNPPLLVLCDQDRFEVHTNYTGTAKQVYRFGLDDLLSDAPTANCALPPLEVLRAVFTNPEELRPEKAAARVTEKAASEFAKLSASLRGRGVDSERAAHFLMRLLFCLFADSIGLLPDHLFRQMIELDKGKPANFRRKLRQLFATMSTSGNSFGVHDIHWFNGGLFADDEVFDLNSADMAILRAAAALDWSNVEPAIFGTLLERSLDPDKRSQLGAHYTSKEDILLIVEPVLIAPLYERWLQVKSEVLQLGNTLDKVKGKAYARVRAQMQATLFGWVEELSKVRVLDPACGSGNFLYLALKRLLDLWKEAYVFTAQHGLPTFLPKEVHPSQLYGLETNIFAHELASVVVWIGYLQWLNQNGIGWPTEPILRRLDNIQLRDAILGHDVDGRPMEPEWPAADVIIGNPPFLGGSKMRGELGDAYCSELRSVYEGRVPGGADLVTYWFERARTAIETHRAKRAGLLATQSIRAGSNRTILERIKNSGGIFMAWQDRPWILDGAAVRVSIIGIDDGSEKTRFVNGSPVLEIHADLSSELNVADAEVLSENAYIGFKGLEKNGSFELTAEEAFSILPLQNPHKLPNSLVVKPWMNASDVTGRDRAMWLVDFGVMSMSDACMFEAPFELVKARVMPLRLKNKDPQRREFWWRPGRSGGDLRQARAGKKRLIVTPRVAKHRLFVWIGSDHIADSRLYVFARDDDYFFGILHSRIHEVWSLANCSWHGDGAQGGRPTYNATSCFETFPFPWPPGREPKDSALTESVAAAARSLVEKRDTWLNPPNANRSDLSQRTLTNLYNNRPQWLQHAHAKLDVAVAAAYGWPADLSTQEILERVLALNAERASKVDFGTKKKPVRSAPSLPSAPATALSRRA